MYRIRACPCTSVDTPGSNRKRFAGGNTKVEELLKLLRALYRRNIRRHQDACQDEPLLQIERFIRGKLRLVN